MVYDGTNATLYWTKLDPTLGAAHVLGTPAKLAMGTAAGAVTGPLVVGNRGRPSGSETFLGAIDEVRISSVARAANQMQFYSPFVTITKNPISQNVDYNQPVTFSVQASSLTPLGYQWFFNSNSIAGATNTSYVITNVAAANAGYYSAVVTNTAGYAATSSPALLVVGAANFLNHRYSFATSYTNATTTNTYVPDLVGGADGTNNGDAYVTNGALVLDGTAGTFMQLPAKLFNATNATALTVEFWAAYGVNANNAYVFSFGYTNFIIGSGIVGIDYVNFSPHNASGNGLYISPSDSSFAQSVTNAGTLDGATWHVACVIDPPDQTLAIYTNGVLEAINTNMTVNLANVNDVLSYIGASLFVADPYLNANIDELRIYNGALSGLSIKQSDAQGPNTVLADGPAKFVINPANTTLAPGLTTTFTAAAVGYLPITYQWFTNGTLVPGATNTSYTFTAVGANTNAPSYHCVSGYQHHRRHHLRYEQHVCNADSGQSALARVDWTKRFGLGHQHIELAEHQHGFDCGFRTVRQRALRQPRQRPTNGESDPDAQSAGRDGEFNGKLHLHLPGQQRLAHWSRHADQGEQRHTDH